MTNMISYQELVRTFPNVLNELLIGYLSGNDQKLMIHLSNIFEVLNEVMKNMSCSPLHIQMGKEDYNNELKTRIIIPFIASLLFEMRFQFNENSAIYYFTDFISKNSPIEGNLGFLVRKYIKEEFNPHDSSNGFGCEFDAFIGKISLKSKLGQTTINKNVKKLKSHLDRTKCIIHSDYLNNLSQSLHGLRLALYFQDHIKFLACCYQHAKSRVNMKNIYWPSLVEISKKISSIKNKKQPKHLIKTNKVINLSEALSIKYHNELHKKYNPSFDVLLNHLMNGDFKKDYSVKLLQTYAQQKNSIYYKIINFNIEVYDKKFVMAEAELVKILSECEQYPNFRLVSGLYKLLIALHIKNNQVKIKNNELSPYINKIITTEPSKEKLTLIIDNCFLNPNSPFLTNVDFQTIIDSISAWHEYLNDSLGIHISKLAEFDVNFSQKIEVSLGKVYTALDGLGKVIENIDVNELTKLVVSSLTTEERNDSIITFLPNLSLYHSLRDISYLYPSFSALTKNQSNSINKFRVESICSKRKLLKALNPSCYAIDEENEKIQLENMA